MGERVRAVSENTRRAQRLLVGGLVGGHVAAVVAVTGVWVVRGTAAGVSALLAAAATLAFYTIGLGVQVAVADAAPRLVLVASLGSYVARVSLFGVLLAFVLGNVEAVGWLDGVAVVLATIAVVLGWLVSEAWVHSRLRIPVYDPPSGRV